MSPANNNNKNMATIKNLLADLRNAHEGRDNQTFYETLDKLELLVSHLDFAPNPARPRAGMTRLGDPKFFVCPVCVRPTDECTCAGPL